MSCATAAAARALIGSTAGGALHHIDPFTAAAAPVSLLGLDVGRLDDLRPFRQSSFTSLMKSAWLEREGRDLLVGEQLDDFRIVHHRRHLALEPRDDRLRRAWRAR